MLSDSAVVIVILF